MGPKSITTHPSKEPTNSTEKQCTDEGHDSSLADDKKNFKPDNCNVTLHTKPAQPHLPTGTGPTGFLHLGKRGTNFLLPAHNRQDGQEKLFKTLRKEYNLPEEHYMNYLQITSHWRAQRVSPILSFQKTFLDTLINTQKYSISQIHPHLQKIYHKKTEDLLVKHWQKEFSCDALKEKMLAGYDHLKTLIVAETWRETQYRILMGAYSTYFYNKIDNIWERNRYLNAQNAGSIWKWSPLNCILGV